MSKDKPGPFKIYDRIPQAAPAGGYLIDDKEGLKEQRSVVWDFVKNVGQNIMNGANMMSTAFPVYINQPRSYLESMTDGLVTAPIFLNKAVACSDPVERMRLVVTFIVSGLHNTCSLKKPFNPILGETFQGSFPDGTSVACEQSSHHPPITAWQIHGPPSAPYHLYGYGEWQASFRGNSVRGAQKGLFLLDFPDGGKITFTLCPVLVNGVLWGDRIIEYDGALTFKDEKNKLSCDITLPNPHGGGFFSSWLGSKVKLPSDHFYGELLQDGTKVATAVGTWLGAIEWDGKSYWAFKDFKEYPKVSGIPLEQALPSDSRNRPDIQLLKAGDSKAAADAKGVLEEKQRRDARLRKEKDLPERQEVANLKPPASSKHKRVASSVT